MKSGENVKGITDAATALDMILETARKEAEAYAKEEMKNREKQIDRLIELGYVGVAFQLMMNDRQY